MAKQPQQVAQWRLARPPHLGQLELPFAPPYGSFSVSAPSNRSAPMRDTNKPHPSRIRCGKAPWWHDHAKVMRTVVTLAVVAGGLFVILSGKYDGHAESWALVAVGGVMGYWLPGRSR